MDDMGGLLSCLFYFTCPRGMIKDGAGNDNISSCNLTDQVDAVHSSCVASERSLTGFEIIASYFF